MKWILIIILCWCVYSYRGDCVESETKVLGVLDNMTTATGQRFSDLENNNVRLDKNVKTIMCHLFPDEEGCEKEE